MHSRVSAITAISILLVAGMQANAQSLQTGSLMGTIRDKAGKPLAGVRIRAKSGQVERVAVSTDKGGFRMPLLNVGDWTLTVSQDGFQTATVKARVGINDTQTVHFTMLPVQSVVVEVVDSAGTMDVTSAQVAQNIDANSLARLPINMTSLNALDGLMATVPGVQTAYTGAFNVMGATDDQNLITVDGNIQNKTYTNSAAAGSWVASTQPAREFIESVEVVTSGFGAEYGAFGGVINSLTKSGSNQWGGSLFYATNFPNSQARTLYNPGFVPAPDKPAAPDKYHRFGGTVTGPIIKDKLFFFVGFQGFKDVIPPATHATGTANWDGLVSQDSRQTGPNQITAKVNWFINPENQLVFSGTHSKLSSDDGDQYPTFGTVNTGTFSESRQQTVNLTWNWMPSSKFYLVASVGRFQNPTLRGPRSKADTTLLVTDYRYFLTGPGSAFGGAVANPAQIGYQTGNGTGYQSYTTNPNTQYRLDLTWFLGSHQLKAGILRQDTSYQSSHTEENFYTISNDQYPTYMFFNSGELDRVHIGSTNTKYAGILASYYLKDVWEVAPGVRIDAGLRFDPVTYKGAAAPYDGMTLVKFSNLGRQLQPRVGLVWDVERDGRKKLFAHFGRFFMNMPMSAVSWASTETFTLDTWFASNWAYNPTYSGGQAPFTLLKSAPDFSYALSTQGVASPVATDLRLAHKDVWTLGGDWIVGKQWTVGALWTFWDLKDALDDSYFLNADGSAAISGVTEKVLWNPRPGKVTFTMADGTVHSWISDFPEPKDRYLSLNLHARHTGENHFLSLDYTWVHHYGNYQGESFNYLNYANTGLQYSFGNGGQTRDFDYAKGITSGNYEGNPVHEFKARGAYRFPILGQTFEIGPAVTWQSGYGLTKTMSAGGRWAAAGGSFGGDPTAQVVTDNQRCNMGHTPSTLLVNLDLAATIKWRRVSIKPSLAIMNLFNSRPVIGYWTNAYTGSNQTAVKADVNYGKVYKWQSGRALTAGFSVQF